MIRLAESLQCVIVLDDHGIGDRDGAFVALVDAMATAGALPPTIKADAVKALIDRAELGPTAIGEGIAIPHAWCRGMSRTVAGLGISGRGLDYESLDGNPVHVVLLILSPPGRPGDAEKLAIMGAWVGRLRDPSFRDGLRLSGGVDEIWQVLRGAGAAS